jgi:hypothetical protein
MDTETPDAYYVIAVAGDGLVLARAVSPLAMTVPDLGQALIAYLGDEPADRAAAACWALRVLLARDFKTTQLKGDVMTIANLSLTAATRDRMVRV